MQVSAIVTTFNRAELAVQAIQSILQQRRPADEIIVIDDGSTDETAAVFKATFGEKMSAITIDSPANKAEPPRDEACLPGKITYVRQPHRGVSAARNTGIRWAKYEWIAFLDADDLWLPQKLARQLQALENNRNYLLCYTDEEWRRHGRWINQGKKHRKYSGWIYSHCLPLCLISPSSVLLHRQLFEQVGLFDETLPACEDYDLWLRITSHYPALFIPERLIVKRAGDWPQLSQQHSLDRYRIIALDKMLHSALLDEQYRQATLNMLLHKCRLYAQGCRKHGRPAEAQWSEEIANKYVREEL